MKKIIYTTSATTKGGDKTIVTSEDGIIDMEIRAPKEMGGPGGHYTNPEQIFAAGFSSCFQSALVYVAHKKNIKATPTVTAKVMTGDNGNGGFIFGVELNVHIPDIDHNMAEKIVEEAEMVCPYANSTRNNIEVKIAVS